MRRMLPRLGGVLRDIWYGLDAAAAIRHGLPVPADPRAAGRRPRIEVVAVIRPPGGRAPGRPTGRTTRPAA